MSEPDFIVIRDPDNPRVSGRWFNLEDYRDKPTLSVERPEVEIWFYFPTPFIEARTDGAVAQVYMRARGSSTERLREP